MSDKQKLLEIKHYLLRKTEYYQHITNRYVRYNNWIQKKFSDHYFHIVDNEGNGDCFFATIRDAFKLHKRIITVEQLRQILSNNATEEVFLQHKYIYDAIISEKNIDTELLREYIFMKDIVTLEDFKKVVLTNRFWANTWAISTLERVLNTKIIILQKEYPSSILCGQLNDSMNSFRPEFYILVNYYQNVHYNLVTYKNRGIFSFKNIPFLIKLAIMDTCMATNAGPYYIISDFREMKYSIENYRIEYEILYLKKMIKRLRKIIIQNSRN